MIAIRQAGSAEEIEAARSLLVDYAASLDLDLGFQGFAEELAGLPGDYVPPRGALLIAWERDSAMGCVALRPLEWPAIAELKRLYVRPEARGRGLGSALSNAAMDLARHADYERVRLDTLPTMKAARHLYEALGFQEIEAYRFNPVPGTGYMELVLVERRRYLR
jgi:ribosomal protein S18 acetylase RimI-like enzyme